MEIIKIDKMSDGYLRIKFPKDEMITTTQNWSDILSDERRKKLNYIKYNYECV